MDNLNLDCCQSNHTNYAFILLIPMLQNPAWSMMPKYGTLKSFCLLDTITFLQICGQPVRDANHLRTTRDTQNTDFIVDHTLLVLHTVDPNVYNSPPTLTSKEAFTQHDRLLEIQLRYEDKEGDDVSFEITHTNYRGKLLLWRDSLT